jgi:predicted nucleic acid-binding protein
MDPRDGAHDRCARLLDDAYERRVIPSPVLVELEFWCAKSLPPGAFCGVLEEIDENRLYVADLLPEDYRRVKKLLETYADLRVGLVDAAILAIVERLREPKLATLDHRHFTVMRPRHVEALELLPT